MKYPASITYDNIENLIDQFRKNGYLTISRKHGSFLPEPGKVGNYDVDAIGKQNKKYAIGVIISQKDLENNDLKEKIIFLATRKSKTDNKNVLLFIGAGRKEYRRMKELVESLDDDIKKNIKLFMLIDKIGVNVRRRDIFS